MAAFPHFVSPVHRLQVKDFYARYRNFLCVAGDSGFHRRQDRGRQGSYADGAIRLTIPSPSLRVTYIDASTDASVKAIDVAARKLDGPRRQPATAQPACSIECCWFV